MINSNQRLRLLSKQLLILFRRAQRLLLTPKILPTITHLRFLPIQVLLKHSQRVIVPILLLPLLKNNQQPIKVIFSTYLPRRIRLMLPKKKISLIHYQRQMVCLQLKEVPDRNCQTFIRSMKRLLSKVRRRPHCPDPSHLQYLEVYCPLHPQNRASKLHRKVNTIAQLLEVTRLLRLC